MPGYKPSGDQQADDVASDSSGMETSPVGRALARRPRDWIRGLSPRHRRIEQLLDPRKTSRMASSGMDATILRGSSTARRPRRWIRRCAHAIAASSECSTHERRREWRLRGWMQPSCVGRARLDARVAGCAAAPMPSPHRAIARPTKDAANGVFGDGCNHPAWVEHGSTPASLDAPLRPRHRPVEQLLDPRKTPRMAPSGMHPNIPRGSSTARRPRRWIRRGAQAIAASSECSTHERRREWRLRGWMQPSCVGRARLDARVAGFAAAPRPSPRRASARPTNDVANGAFGDGENYGLTVANALPKTAICRRKGEGYPGVAWVRPRCADAARSPDADAPMRKIGRRPPLARAPRCLRGASRRARSGSRSGWRPVLWRSSCGHSLVGVGGLPAPG
jgi:hypothetical protein